MKMNPVVLALLMVFAAMESHADPAVRSLLPDGKSRPSRSTILVLGDAGGMEVIRKAQEMSEDRFTFYVTDPQVASAEELLALLEKDGEGIGSKKWHAFYIAFSEPASDSMKAKISSHLPEVSAKILWGDGKTPPLKELEKALMRNSENLAVWPESERRDPAKLLADDGSLDDPDSLPVLPTETSTVFRAEEGGWKFNLHSFIAFHDGKFRAIWSSGRADEDSSSQMIRYASSVDGRNWDENGIVAPDPDGEDGSLRWLASGLYVENGNLYALGCRNEGGKGGKVWSGAQLVRFRWAEGGWKEEGVFAEDSMVYFPPYKVNGRDFFVWRDAAAHFSTARSGPEAGKWEVKGHPNFPPDYRMSETGSYVDADGVIHLIIRDQGKTKRLYQSLSFDRGDTWTLPVKTNYPDAVSKNFAGRLGNGLFYLINNPKANGLRDPLVISFSKDGWSYSGPRILRKESPARRFAGKFKPERSFQYSDAMEHDGKLWVIYATNKEDIEVSSYDISLMAP